MSRGSLSRRRFVQVLSTTAVGSMLPGGLVAKETSATEAGVSGSATAARDYRRFPGKNTRLCISMWDFSWLKAHHPGGAYEDLERRVAEAAARGYNALRVDCFPSRILESESTFEKNWTAGTDLPHWGQTAATFTCKVREEVAKLANLCRKHGIWLGLDSWDKPHMFGHKNVIAAADEQREFSRYGEIWAKALKLMREDGVLERAVWIAPMNEVPHFASRSVGAIADLGKRPLDEGETVLEKGQKEDEIYRRINVWMAEPIKAETARDAIPISYSSLGSERFANRLSDLYDVVDVHFMPGVITDKEDNAAFAKAARGVKPPHRFTEFVKMDLKAYSAAWDRACRKHYGAMLKRTRDYHVTCLQNMTLASGKRLTAINTEPFGPCFWPDHPDVGWDWYKRYNADALRVMAALDFAGSSLSNYAEPIFTLWNDADWHWTSNAYLREAM